MSPHCLHTLQTNVFKFSVSLLVPRVLLVHLLSKSGINIILLALPNFIQSDLPFFFFSPSIWTRGQGQNKVLKSCKKFPICSYFICCETVHVLYVPKVTTCNLRTESNTDYTRWKKNDTAEETAAFQRLQQHYERSGRQSLPATKDISITQIFQI